MLMWSYTFCQYMSWQISKCCIMHKTSWAWPFWQQCLPASIATHGKHDIRSLFQEVMQQRLARSINANKCRKPSLELPLFYAFSCMAALSITLYQHFLHVMFLYHNYIICKSDIQTNVHYNEHRLHWLNVYVIEFIPIHIISHHILSL